MKIDMKARTKKFTLDCASIKTARNNQNLKK